MKRLSEIYYKVKSNFIWTSDKELHGVGEHWTSCADEVDAGKVFRGDCDDFALTCAELLFREGYEPSRISIDFCTTEAGQGHLVCVCDGVALDNRQRRPLFMTALPGYRWRSRMLLSERGTWRRTRMVMV